MGPPPTASLRWKDTPLTCRGPASVLGSGCFRPCSLKSPSLLCDSGIQGAVLLCRIQKEPKWARGVVPFFVVGQPLSETLSF